jgi:hypothetical protein
MAFSSSGVSPNQFIDFNEIVQARNAIARNRRQEELQPGRVEEQRISNELNAFSVDENERKVEERKRLAIAKAALADPKQPQAGINMAREFPKEFTEILDVEATKRKMDQTERDRAAFSMARLSTAFGAMGKEGTPEDWKRMRDRVLKNNPKLRPDDIPEKPNAAFMRAAVVLGSGAAELAKRQPNKFIDVGVPGKPGATRTRRVPEVGEDETFGPPVEPAPSASSGGGRGPGGGFEVTASISNSIRRQVNDLFGAIFDLENDTIVVLDPSERKEMLGMSARAEEIFEETGLSVARAVRQAANEFNIDIPEVKPGGAKTENFKTKEERRDKALNAAKKFVDDLP